MAEIKDLSTTDANNTGTAANAGFPENMAYSDVNNAARALEGMIARLYADTNGTVTTTGSSNAYLLTPNQTVAAYAAGDRYVFKASFTNTGAVTINVSSLGAKSIVKPSGDALASGEIASGGLYEVIYDGTNFQMQGADDPENLTLTSLTVTGTTALNGNTTIGDAATDTVTITADVASDLIPSADGTHDLGAVGSEWQDLFIDGTANIDSLVADTADIDGGTVDGVVIGGASAAAGTFTTLVANTSLNIAGDGATVTGIKDEDNMASDSATKLATQQSIKAYVDSQVTAQDLDVISDSGNISVDLDSQSLTLTGGSGLDTSATGQTVTIAIDSTVATLTGSQTLTNKTLTAPVISTISNTGTITLPTATDTLVGRDTSDTLTNKTLTSAVLNTAVSGTAVLDEDDMSSNSSTQIATQQSIKAYVDSQVTAQDLDVTDGSSSIDIDLDSESLGILGGTGIDSTASGTGVTLSIDSTVATLTGSQTLTNKSLTAPTLTGTAVVASLDISGDVDVDGVLHADQVDIDGAVDMASTLTSGPHLINASSSAFGGSSVQGYNTDFLVDSGEGFTRHNSYHTGGSNHQFLVNEASSTTNAVAFSIAKDQTSTFNGSLQARRARSNTTGDVALSVQPSDSTIHYGFRIDSSNNNLNLDRADSGNEAQLLTVSSSGDFGFGTATLNKFFNLADPAQGGETLKLHFEASSSNDKWAIYSYDRTNGHYADLSFGANYLYLKSGGSVGIAQTPSGNHKLEITQSGGDGINVNSGADFGGIRLTDNSHSFAIRNYANNLLIYDVTNTQQRVTLDDSGVFMVAKSTSSSNNVGFETSQTGNTSITRSGGQPLLLNRQTDDGDIILLRKDGTTIGSIGVNAGDNIYFAGGSGSTKGIYINQVAVYPADQGGGPIDNSVDLGQATYRWKDLYLSGGVFLGGTGSANELDDYEEGTHATAFSASTSGTVTHGYNTMAYTKVGRLVTCTGYFTISSVSSPVGYLAFSLPFTIPVGNQYSASASVSFNTLSSGAVYEAWAICVNNTNLCRVYVGSTTGASASFAQLVQAGTDVRVTISFMVS